MSSAVSTLLPHRAVSRCRRYVFLPPAGGTLTTLRAVADAAPPASVWGIEYPGRGHRIAESLPAALPDLAEQLARELVERFGPRTIARTVLVGFSMGAFVALEVAHRVLARCGAPPAALVVVGAVAPQRRAPGRHARFDDDTLTRLLAGHGLTPGSSEVWEYAMELLRGDLRLASEYRLPAIDAAPCPVAALCGADDPSVTSVDDATEGWRPWATGSFTAEAVPGGHLDLLAPGREQEFWMWMRHLERAMLDD